MKYPVNFGLLQAGLILLLIIAVALLISAVLRVRKVGLRVLLGRGAGGLVLLIVAVMLLWIATLTQTYLGLSGEIKAAHIVVKEVAGQDHQLDVKLTLHGDDGQPAREEQHRVQGDLWALQANIVELKPWVNVLGFHSGYRITRLYGQRLDGVATTQNQIFLNGEDRDFFTDMRKGKWYTDPFVRSAYGNVAIAGPGEYDIYISRDAIKPRAVSRR